MNSKDYMEKVDPLLTREEFKEQVFDRTCGLCCVPGCEEDAVDAHHIMDRKLWTDGGYYLSNGAALCSKHHIDAEQGRITPAQCLEYMGIDPINVRIPDALKKEYDDQPGYHYPLAIGSGMLDKWGKLHTEKKEEDYDPDWYKKYENKK